MFSVLGKGGRRGGRVGFELVWVVADSLSKEEKLILVPFAPFKNEKMQPDSEAHSKRERVIHRFGEKLGDDIAWRGLPD